MEISLTGRCARAIHRGQCSIASQRALGVMLKPHLEQSQSSWRRGVDAGLPAFISIAPSIEVGRFRRATRSPRHGTEVMSSGGRYPPQPTRRPSAQSIGRSDGRLGLHRSWPSKEALLDEPIVWHTTPSHALVIPNLRRRHLAGAPTTPPTITLFPGRSIRSSPARERGDPPLRARSAMVRPGGRAAARGSDRHGEPRSPRPHGPVENRT